MSYMDNNTNFFGENAKRFEEGALQRFSKAATLSLRLQVSP